MPVTVKFSEHFYGKFGHEAVDELVNFLNGLDSAYRSELRELNERNFGSFDERLERRFAQLDVQLAEFKADVKTEMAVRFSAVHAGFEKLRSEIAAARADTIKWTFFFIATAVLAILGLT